jgi:molybdopterin-guanine dinucleotide biosynthesis protein A
MRTAPMIAGLILAGGAGQRLGGVRKGDLRLRNAPLHRWTTARLRSQVDTILFSVPATGAGSHENHVALPDAPDGLTGPAAGLLAGARWCAKQNRESIMLSVPVDSPLFPPDFVSRALPLLHNVSHCVLAGYGEQQYPTTAIWRVSALLERLEREPNSAKGPRLRDIAAQLGAVVCFYDDQPTNPFLGINTLPNLLEISGLLRRTENSE